MAKTTCPITRDEFRQHAQEIKVAIGDRSFTAKPKEFSTGSLGWNINDKITIQINGKDVTLQVGMNLTIVGSKELPGAPAATD
ncbi:MAG: hypothetical protein ACJ8F7_10920 [Gemmataceae bacterium]